MSSHRLPLILLAGCLIAACEQKSPTTPGAAPSLGHVHPSTDTRGSLEPNPDVQQQIARLRPLFARYHDLDKAVADGYAFVGPCVSDPVLGGMGDHYSLHADDDFGRGDGTYVLERPQYLVYAPQKNGGRRLAALDYTVPYEKWSGADPPEFFGIPFTRNDGFGVYMFHIWLFEHNPAGMFANFNPSVPQC